MRKKGSSGGASPQRGGALDQWGGGEAAPTVAADRMCTRGTAFRSIAERGGSGRPSAVTAAGIPPLFKLLERGGHLLCTSSRFFLFGDFKSFLFLLIRP